MLGTKWGCRTLVSGNWIAPPHPLPTYAPSPLPASTAPSLATTRLPFHSLSHHSLLHPFLAPLPPCPRPRSLSLLAPSLPPALPLLDCPPPCYTARPPFHSLSPCLPSLSHHPSNPFLLLSARHPRPRSPSLLPCFPSSRSLLWATARSLLLSSLPPSIPSSLIPSLAPHPSSPPPSPPFAPSLPLPSARLVPPSIWFTLKCSGPLAYSTGRTQCQLHLPSPSHICTIAAPPPCPLDRTIAPSPIHPLIASPHVRKKGTHVRR